LAELEAGIVTYDEVYGARGLDWRSSLEAKAQQALFVRQLAEKYNLDVSEISTIQKEKAPSVPVAAIAIDTEDDAPAPIAAPDNGNTSPVVDDTLVTAVVKKQRKPRAKKTE
jgi:hypothetical protein